METIDVARAWEAVQNRDPDAAFLYAVTTTNVYCRPTCGSKLPLRKNVQFFESTDEAERAGFRPCKRCRPNDSEDQWVRIAARVCSYIDEHLDEPLTLDVLGREVGVSGPHLQRRFKAIVGMSPAAYRRERRFGRLREELLEGTPITDAIYEAGFSSPSRMYESARRELGMTPSSFRDGGEGLSIRYATALTPIGTVLVAATELGICRVAFADQRGSLIEELRADFDQAVVEEDERLAPMLEKIAEHARGDRAIEALPLDVRTTAFKHRVLEALRQIPLGETRSYGQIAEAIGAPSSTRAVANAIASNPVALLIPCHRVVRANGELGGYRWGAERKRKLLEAEGRMK